ncbi:MAG: M23 family metallopeptidase [Alphaproteobacteria bacterium]|nr:M23 family metallopeptidase [Alphaproteobacteria bacterium]
MRNRVGARRGIGPSSWVVLLGCGLAACAPGVEAPAPVIAGAAPAERGSEMITVQRGQTLSEIAHSYHIPMRVIAEANALAPPYRIQTGRRLIIPGAGPPRAPTSVAALPPSKLPDAASSVAPNPPPPAAPDQPPVSAAPLTPEAKPVPTVAAPAPVQTIPEAAPDSGSAAAPPAAGGSAFLWPVRGHVVATYGTRSDGSHNDGINIAAPRGTAVEAVDGGIVAYTGNELRGYGNLILVKHANGWISAYAHCDQILVKRGEKVTRGQVIARVGSTGNVTEPQLHFELRRGQHAVDPREFLTPSPTAAM